MYQADVTNNLHDEYKYPKLTETLFNERLNNHKGLFRNESKNTSKELSKYVLTNAINISS